MPDSEIIDAAGQLNVELVGVAPGVATGKLYQAMAQAAAMVATNGASAQQQMNITGQAGVATGVGIIYSVDTAAVGLPAKKKT